MDQIPSESSPVPEQKEQVTHRNRISLALRLAGGLVLVVVIAIVGSIAIRNVTAPKQFDLYEPVALDPSCDVRDDGEGVIVVMTLKPKPAMDPSNWQVRAQAVDASNATIVGVDLWEGGVGFAAEDAAPTAAMINLPWQRGLFDPTTAQLTEATPINVAIAITTKEASEPVELGPIQIITTTGEPEYVQTFSVLLHAHLDVCEVSTVAAATR
ncbi:hypothetical protein [Herbiconiux liangxiaofengii]|uniref:hypothetical protein n=1 Tax=Herbiconiux liangxiaofengii TaxID=3342795 RepID=UPI0035B8A3AE